jgi:hypothetical protein
MIERATTSIVQTHIDRSISHISYNVALHLQGKTASKSAWLLTPFSAATKSTIGTVSTTATVSAIIFIFYNKNRKLQNVLDL